MTSPRVAPNIPDLGGARVYGDYARVVADAIARDEPMWVLIGFSAISGSVKTSWSSNLNGEAAFAIIQQGGADLYAMIQQQAQEAYEAEQAAIRAAQPPQGDTSLPEDVTPEELFSAVRRLRLEREAAAGRVEEEVAALAEESPPEEPEPPTPRRTRRQQPPMVVVDESQVT